MADFTTRVQLHGGIDQDYETLHAAMEREGFARVIESDAGEFFHLPTAEYVRSSSLPGARILESAKRAAAVTKKSHAVFVTESVSWFWYKLDPVR